MIQKKSATPRSPLFRFSVVKTRISHSLFCSEKVVCFKSEAFTLAFKMWWRRFFTTVRAQEEIVDPQEVLREKCNKKAKIKDLHDILETCNARVRSKKNTTEACMEELVDYLHALDHCVADDLFKHLK